MPTKDPYDPSNYEYMWQLPPPPPPPAAREKNWFDKSVEGVTDFVPALGLGAYRAVTRETPATAAVGAGAVARGVAEGSDNPFTGLLALSGVDKYLSTANPVAGLAADVGARFVDQRLIDPLSEQTKGGLRDFANRQFVNAEIGRRQFDIDNPVDAEMQGNLGYQFGQSLGQMGVALGAGLATGAVTRNPALAQAATVGTMGAQNLASNISAQQQARGVYTDIDVGAASRGAVAQTGVDLILGRFLGADDITKAMAGGTFGSAITRGARAGGLKGAREEGIAEVIQTGIERGQAGLDLTNESALGEYGQSFIMGAALGGGMGAVSGAYSSAIDQKNANDPNRTFNNREAIGAEGRLKALMDEQAANAAYNQLNPSPFTTLGEQITAGGEFDNQRLANEIADARAAARLIEERKQGELLQLPAPDPMAYDPSSVTGRPATQEEILMAQQTGGAPNVAPVLALPNPNTAPIVVDPTGVAQRTDEPLRVEQERAREAIGSPERDVQAATLVQQAAVTKRTQSEPSSPYETRAMLTVRGKPAYTVTVVGPGAKPNTAKVFNNDTRTMVEVPRSRVTSVAEARDPKALNRLSPDVRRAEEVRAKELHQRQLEAIINPQPATEAVPPSAATVEPTTDVGVSLPPPMAEAPVVQREGSFVNETPIPLTDQPAPVNETPENELIFPLKPIPQIPEADMQGELPTDPRSNSWIIQDLETGKPVMETFSPDVASKVNKTKYKVWPTYQWLTSLNAASPNGMKPTEANVKKMRKAIGKDAKMPYEERQRLAQIGETQTTTVAELAQSVESVAEISQATRAAQNKVAQVTTGPAITNPDGPELATAAEPMSTTDDDAVFAIQKVEAATLDPNFRSQVVLALRDEFRKLGFGSNIPLALEFSDQAGAAAMLKTENGKQTIVIALGLANNTRDVPGAIQAMRPFLTHEVVEFAQKHDLLKPEERTVLLDYAKTHKAADGKTLYETVVERYGDLARANNQPEAYLEREAIAYATEYLTRLNPQKWGDSPQNPSSAARQRRRADPRAKNKPSAETKAANSFKDKIIAFGKSLFKGLEKAYPTKTADGSTLAQDIALRLAKGDIAHRARTNPRFVQEVKFAGWSAPPAEIKVLGTQLRNYLDSMGLPDVGLRMATGILNSDGKTWSAAASGTMGSYYARTITVSMEAYNPNLTYEQNLKNLIKVVDHEVVHALRATGAWSPNEWMNITKYVRTAKDPITGETYFEKAQRHYGSYVKGMQPAVAQDVLNEEAVAMAFADNFDIRIPRPTGPKRLLDRIAEVTLGLARAMHATGRPSAELLMANGNSVSEAVRAGIAAKNRRERGASSPAETSVKFSIAPDKMANVNPAMDPDAEDVFNQLNSIDPIADFFEKSKEQLADLFGVIERRVPWTQKAPFARMFAPMAEVEGHDAFKTLKGRTVGAIHELKETTAKLLEEGLRLTQKNPAARDAVNAYLETKGADPYSPRLPSGAKNPAYIENKRLRDITVAAKERIRMHGRIAVDLGFISQEAFDNLDGAYLHHMDITSDRKVINSQRLLLPDLSWTRKRRGLDEDERTLRGAVSNPFVSIGTYLSLSGEAFLIDRMYDHMLQWSKDRSEAGGRPWVMDTEHMINWRGQDWSPAAVEAEIEFLRGDVTDMARPTGVPDAKHDAKMATIERALKESRALLLRNPLWQKMHDTTAAEISQMLGVDPAQADLAKLDNATIQQVYDTVLRRRPKVRNEIDGPAGALADMAKDSVGAGAKFIGNDYVEIPDTARWGRLRGMAVDRALYDIMNATGAMFTKTVEDRAQVVSKEEKADPMSLLRKVISPEAYMIMHSTFKKLNTVYNLPTHGTNWAGNLVMFETMGGALPGESARYAYEAAKQLINGGPAFDIVRKYGGVQTGQMASEITNLTNPRIQAALAEALDGFDIDDPKASAMNLGRRILAAANKLDTNMSNAYQLSDTLFRVAKVQMDMDRGLTETEAFLNAQDLYLDYTIVPNFIRFIRTMPFGAPFISWTYLSTGLFLDKMGSSAVIHRNNEEFDADGNPKEIRIPHVFLMMPMVAVFAAMSAIFRADDFEDEDQKYLEVGLPKFTDGGVGLAFVGVDDQGRPVFFDWMKYFAGGTLFRIGAGLDNVRESDNRPVGFAGILKELGMGSDPATALYNIWINSKDPNSGKPLDKPLSTGGEAFASQVGATVGLFLPPMLTPGGSNPILGDYGITNAAANRDSPTVAYEQGRPALALSQKLLRLTGAGIYVTDPMPDLDKKAKEATRVRSTVQSELTQAMKDEGLSPDVRDKKILEINKRYERAMEREEKAKAMLAEIGPFYERLRAVTIAKSGIDPAIANAETLAKRKDKTTQEEVLERIRIAQGLEDARN